MIGVFIENGLGVCIDSLENDFGDDEENKGLVTHYKEEKTDRSWSDRRTL